MKNFSMRISPPRGRVQLRVPYLATSRQVQNFIRNSLPEIRAAQEKILASVLPLNYAPGERHYLWGIPYTLEVVDSARKIWVDKSSEVEAGNREAKKLVFHIPSSKRNSEKGAELGDRALQEFYRQELQAVLPEYIEKCEEITGVKAESYRIKNMRTRWGSCNTNARRIWVNLQLAKLPPRCLEYVLIHELVHLQEPKHNQDFYLLLERYCPNWRNQDPNNWEMSFRGK